MQLRKRLLKQFRRLRSRRLRLLVWCARKHRHHHWSPLAMTLLLCCVMGSIISHIDGALILGEMLVALVDMVLQGYNAHHHLKHTHRSLKRKNPHHWQRIRRKQVWSEIRFKSPLAVCILIVILIILLGFHLPI